MVTSPGPPQAQAAPTTAHRPRRARSAAGNSRSRRTRRRQQARARTVEMMGRSPSCAAQPMSTLWYSVFSASVPFRIVPSRRTAWMVCARAKGGVRWCRAGGGWDRWQARARGARGAGSAGVPAGAPASHISDHINTQAKLARAFTASSGRMHALPPLKRDTQHRYPKKLNVKESGRPSTASSYRMPALPPSTKSTTQTSITHRRN